MFLALPVLLQALGSAAGAAQESDPYESSGFQCSADDVPESRVRFRVEYDLNLDGVQDYLLAMAPCGNAGCQFAAVVSSDAGYGTVGPVFFHPLAAQLAPSPPDASLLKAFVRQNAERGRLLTYQISSAGVVTLEDAPMSPISTDEREYEALFGPTARARAERGLCIDPGARLSWAPY